VSQLKICDFTGEILKVLKCYNFLWVQRRHNCSPAASIANCLMTLYLLKVHLQMFLSIPITQTCQILSCDTLVANERFSLLHYKVFWGYKITFFPTGSCTPYRILYYFCFPNVSYLWIASLFNLGNHTFWSEPETVSIIAQYYFLELVLRNMFLPRRFNISVQYFVLLVYQNE